VAVAGGRRRLAELEADAATKTPSRDRRTAHCAQSYSRVSVLPSAMSNPASRHRPTSGRT
jgi:hypothetical protein